VNSFRGNYSFLNLEIVENSNTLDSGINVAPGINIAHGPFGKKY
jgi:hypothetical protein